MMPAMQEGFPSTANPPRREQKSRLEIRSLSALATRTFQWKYLTFRRPSIKRMCPVYTGISDLTWSKQLYYNESGGIVLRNRG